MARTPRDRRGIAGVPPARAAAPDRAAAYAVEVSVIQPRTAPRPRAAVYASGGRHRGSRPVETRPGSALAMNLSPPATTHVGPLGSTVHVIRADAGTVAELAAVDWSRRFRRVCLDPVRGLIALTAPSHLHEDLTKIFDDVVETAADGLGHISKGLRSVRLRGWRGSVRVREPDPPPWTAAARGSGPNPEPGRVGPG